MGDGIEGTAGSAPSEDPKHAWAQYQQVGPQHALIGRKVGSWDLSLTVYAAPGVKAFESRGTSTYAWILGGRVLENLVVGAPDGHPFEGRGYSGFDTRNGHYWFVWMDSMGTGHMRGEGRALPTNDGVQWTSEATDVVARGVRRVRSVERFLSVDEWTSDTYSISGDGHEYVATSFHFRRRT